MEKTFKTLARYGISKEIIEGCLTVLARGKSDEIERIFKVLDEHKISKTSIENCLTVLANGNADEIENIFKVLDEHNIEKTAIEGCLSILANGKADEIRDIFKVLDDHKISQEAIEKHLYVLAKGKPNQIKEIFRVLDKHKIDKEAIENCLSVLTKSDATDLDNILIILKDHNISKKRIEGCLSVLFLGNAKEIEDVFNILDKHKISSEAINKCLSLFAGGKADDIDEMLNILEERKISHSVIEGCLSILLTGKPDELREIFKVLDKHDVSKDIVETCLTLLGTAKAEELDKILNILEGENIKPNTIEGELTGIMLAYKTAEDFQEVFNVKVIPKNRRLHLRNVRRYMRLKGMYGRFYTREEIEEFCSIRRITVEEFITEITLFPNKNINIEKYQNLLERRGKLYVGGSIPIDNAYLEEHGEELIKLARKAANAFGRITGETDLAELESRALEIIVTKGGNIVRQLEDNTEMLNAALVSKAKKSLYNEIGESPIRFSRLYDNLTTSEYGIAPSYVEEEERKLSEKIDMKEAGFSSAEQEVMSTLIELVERGEANGLMGKVAYITGIEIDEVMEIVETIGQKVLDKGIVKQRGSAGFEFAD